MREISTLQLLSIFNRYNIDNVKVYDPRVKENKTKKLIRRL